MYSNFNVTLSDASPEMLQSVGGQRIGNSDSEYSCLNESYNKEHIETNSDIANSNSMAESLKNIKGTFDQLIFGPRYQRNNKAGGLKNLRCFPSCGFRHKEQGFCGRSLEIEVVHNDSGIDSRLLCCWVEFVPKNDSPIYHVGDLVDLDSVLAKERNKADPTLPFIKGDRVDQKCDDQVSVFEFNKERKGWHYSWTSTSQTCDAEHCLQCYLFYPESNRLRCIDVFRSPPFTLFCRRRRKFLLPSDEATNSTDTDLKRAGSSNDNEIPAAKRERIFSFDEQPLHQSPSMSRQTTMQNDVHALDAVMRRLVIIMSRIQQQQAQREAATVQDGSDIFDWDKDTEEFFSSQFFEALEGFAANNPGEVLGDSWLEDSLDQIDSVTDTPSPAGQSPPPAHVTMSQPATHQDSRSASEQMIDDIANYLGRDRGFQRTVTMFSRPSRGAPDYKGFLRQVNAHLESYRRSRNIGLTEFNKLFNQAAVELPRQEGVHAPVSADAFEPPAQQSLLGRLTKYVSNMGTSSSSTFHEPQPMFLPGPGMIQVPNIQGMWRQTPSSEQRMHELRNKIGTPWILSKIFEFMESRFSIVILGLEMRTTLSRAWISNTLVFILDGEEHRWGISLPGPFSQLSQGWKYRAWIDGKRIIISHTIGNQRLTRINWVNSDRTVLYWTVIVEVWDQSTGSYQELARVLQQADAESS